MICTQLANTVYTGDGRCNVYRLEYDKELALQRCSDRLPTG